MNAPLKRLAANTAIVLATLGAAALLWHFRGIAGLFVFSLAAAATVRPLVDRQQWLGRGWAIVLTYLAGVGLFLLIAAIGANHILTELQQAVDSIVIGYERAWLQWPAGAAWQRAAAAWLPAPSMLFEAWAGEQDTTMLAGLLNLTTGLFDHLAALAILLALSMYWSLDQARFERLWLSALPTGRRAQARAVWRNIETEVGAYLRSELAQTLLAAVLLGLGYRLMGLKYPTLLTLAGALAWLVPWLGAVLAVAPAVLVGTLAAGGSAALGAGAGLYTLAVLLALEYLVEPRLAARRRHSSLLVVLLAMGLSQAWGWAGVLAAPPLAAALHSLFSQILPQNAPGPAGQMAGQIADLQKRLAAVQAALSAAAEPAPPETRSLIARLSRLLAEAPAPSAGPAGAPPTATQ